jgi:predicted NUDIX family NTP pyrophosphohydrolase
VYRHGGDSFEVLLGHPGGPYWASKHRGVWSIPKGHFEAGEAALDAAKREFSEEVGFPVPNGELVALGTVKLASGKVVHVWAVEGDIDVSKAISNHIDIEWPPHSQNVISIPEIDRVTWFDVDDALIAVAAAQAELIYRLADYLQVPLQRPA